MPFMHIVLLAALAGSPQATAAPPKEALDGIDPVVLLTTGKEVSGKAEPRGRSRPVPVPLRHAREQGDVREVAGEIRDPVERGVRADGRRRDRESVRLRGGRRQDLHLRQRRLSQEVRRRAGEVPAEDRRRRCPRRRRRSRRDARWSSAWSRRSAARRSWTRSRPTSKPRRRSRSGRPATRRSR